MFHCEELSAIVMEAAVTGRLTDGEEVDKHGTRASAQDRLHSRPIGELDHGVVEGVHLVSVCNLEDNGAGPPVGS